MRKTIILLALILAGLSTATAQAPETDSGPNPGIVPGNPLFGVEKFVESLEVRIAGLIGGPDMKSKALANNAQERLAEARMLSDINRLEEAQRALQQYSSNINRSRDIARENNNSDLGSQLDDISERNTDTLNGIKKKVPEEAKKGIENAIENSKRSRPDSAPDMKRGPGPTERPGPPMEEGLSSPFNETGRVVERPDIVNETRDTNLTERPEALKNTSRVEKENQDPGDPVQESEQNISGTLGSEEDEDSQPDSGSSSPESSDKTPSDRLTENLP